MKAATATSLGDRLGATGFVFLLPALMLGIASWALIYYSSGEPSDGASRFMLRAGIASGVAAGMFIAAAILLWINAIWT